MEPLSPSFRRELRARAHALEPVVAVGHHGLTPSVLREIDVALKAHELVKVRVHGDDRAERDALLARIAEALDCAPVQQIGKLLVVWRPRPVEPSEPAPRPRAAAPRSRGGAPPPKSHPATAPKARERALDVRRAPAGVPRAASRRRRRTAR